MFEKLGQLTGLLQQLPRVRAEVEQLQQRLAQYAAEGDAGGGMVKVRMNGKFEVLGVCLSEEAFRLNDREMLEDLIRSATNQALERVRSHATEEAGKIARSLGLPPGFGLGTGL
jgi:DNA-binding YbaB/EbfC family protein